MPADEPAAPAVAVGLFRGAFDVPGRCRRTTGLVRRGLALDAADAGGTEGGE